MLCVSAHKAACSLSGSPWRLQSAQACKLRLISARHSTLAGTALQPARKSRSHTCRTRAPLRATAMINVDGSPPLFLGGGMILAGLILYQLRNSRPYITKDFDIVLSCIAIFAGGILVFQGWRLDPLLLFGQLLTAGGAVSFGFEAVRLRQIVHKQELADAEFEEQQRGQAGPPGQYNQPLPLPRPWEQAQMPASRQEPAPWWQEQQSRIAEYDQVPYDTAESSSQNRQSWSSQADSYPQQQGGGNTQPASSRQQQEQQQPQWPQQQEQQQPQWPQQQQQWAPQQQQQQQSNTSRSQQSRQPSGGAQKSWGSKFDLGKLDDWDSD